MDADYTLQKAMEETMEADYISIYTRQQAIEDGIFIDVTGVAKKIGFKIPVAITTNLYNNHIKQPKDNETNDLLNAFLLSIHNAMCNDDMICTTFDFGNGEQTRIWSVLESQSPTDPSLAMNIMLPEDY